MDNENRVLLQLNVPSSDSMESEGTDSDSSSGLTAALKALLPRAPRTKFARVPARAPPAADTDSRRCQRLRPVSALVDVARRRTSHARS